MYRWTNRVYQQLVGQYYSLADIIGAIIIATILAMPWALWFASWD